MLSSSLESPNAEALVRKLSSILASLLLVIHVDKLKEWSLCEAGFRGQTLRTSPQIDNPPREILPEE